MCKVNNYSIGTGFAASVGDFNSIRSDDDARDIATTWADVFLHSEAGVAFRGESGIIKYKHENIHSVGTSPRVFILG